MTQEQEQEVSNLDAKLGIHLKQGLTEDYFVCVEGLEVAHKERSTCYGGLILALILYSSLNLNSKTESTLAL